MEYKFVTLEKKKSLVKRKKVFRKLLTIIFVLICLIGSLGLLIRGYFQQNPLLFNNSDLKTLNAELKPNEIVDLENFKRQDLIDNNKRFGDAIKTISSPQFKNSHAWLKILTNESLNIGYLEKDDNFVLVYRLPKEASLVRLYDDESTSYVLNPQNGSQAKLLGLDKNDNQYQISTLKLGEYFTSTWFDPSGKEFYVTIIDSQGFFSIGFINQNSELVKIYTTTALGKEAFVINSSSTEIQINNKNHCYSIKLLDKSLNNIACAEIQINSISLDNLDVKILPVDEITEAFEFNSGKYVVTGGVSDQYSLLKYILPETPSSYPSDFWKTVDLKLGSIKALNLI